MCVAKRSGLETVTVGLTSGPFLGPSKSRFGLVISAPAANPVFISDQNPATTTNAFRLAPGTAPVFVNVRDHGDFWAKPLTAIATTAPETIGIVQVMEKEYETNPPDTGIPRE